MRYYNIPEHKLNELLDRYSYYLFDMTGIGSSASYPIPKDAFKPATREDVPEQRVILSFTTEAWTKMLTLVTTNNLEIAWHGICQREGFRKYLVSDILVYPQEVTGATVTTDQVAYQDWLMNLPDDTFNNLRFQGHSHVSMGVEPSITDLDNEQGLLKQLGNRDFYVFLIANKRGNFRTLIVDKEDNMIYESTDIDISVRTDTYLLEDWLASSMKLVTKSKPLTPKQAKPKPADSKPAPVSVKSVPSYASSYTDFDVDDDKPFDYDEWLNRPF